MQVKNHIIMSQLHFSTSLCNFKNHVQSIFDVIFIYIFKFLIINDNTHYNKFYISSRMNI